MSTRKILIVDDEPLIRNLLTDALSKVGYSPYPAANANDALAILKKESIPFMMLDLGLSPMNGFDLCKNIRKDHPKAIIYALSGYTGYYDPQQFLEAGFNGVFDKPIIFNDLYQVVKESFEKLGV